jgi:hypothetical protein
MSYMACSSGSAYCCCGGACSAFITAWLPRCRGPAAVPSVRARAFSAHWVTSARPTSAYCCNRVSAACAHRAYSAKSVYFTLACSACYGVLEVQGFLVQAGLLWLPATRARVRENTNEQRLHMQGCTSSIAGMGLYNRDRSISGRECARRSVFVGSIRCALPGHQAVSKGQRRLSSGVTAMFCLLPPLLTISGRSRAASPPTHHHRRC